MKSQTHRKRHVQPYASDKHLTNLLRVFTSSCQEVTCATQKEHFLESTAVASKGTSATHTSIMCVGEDVPRVLATVNTSVPDAAGPLVISNAWRPYDSFFRHRDCGQARNNVYAKTLTQPFCAQQLVRFVHALTHCHHLGLSRRENALISCAAGGVRPARL